MTNDYNQNEKKDRDTRNIILTVMGVFIILAAVAGGTFAYYAFSVTNTGTISGSAANTTGIGMTVTKVAPTKSGATTVLVPQLQSTLNKAIIGTNNYKCIDGNDNTVCLIYKVDVSNTSSSGFNYTLKIKFTNGTNSKFTNLKYAFLPTTSFSATSYTSVVTSTMTSATTTDQNIITSQTIAVSGSNTHYFVVWLNETNNEQKSTDYGTFTGTVTLTDNAGNQYLTSTFTS